MSKAFDNKSRGLDLLVETSHPRTSEILQLLSDSQLYYHKKDKRLFIITHYVTGKVAKDLQGNEQVIKKKRDFKKVTLNNKMRGQINRIQAELGLNADNPQQREAAVRDLLKDITPGTVATLKTRFLIEESKNVREMINIALAINDLKSSDDVLLSNAIEQLDGSLEQESRSALVAFVSTAQSPLLKKQAQIALKGIEDKVQYYGWLETLYFGLSLGSVLVLAGIGLAITFGVMGVINMAHGELIMIGAYTTYVIQLLMPDHIEWSILVAIPAAFVVSGLVGIAIERGVIRFLYGRPLETLLATFGISLILQQAVRSLFSPLNRSVETPDWMSGLIQINPVFSLTLSRLYIILFCLVVFVALLLVLKKTALGLQVRAVSQNRAMARSMGIRSNRVDALTFGLGSGVAGIAGVALSQLTNVGPNMGQAYIIDSFMVVVFGGVGNLWGTLVAGLSLGVANKVLEPWAGAVLAKVLMLIFIILFIQKRPRGLFPQRGRAAEG
ncbi:urea transport system permease protein [Neptunomonas japonica JAMM 1380]|uniref:Urea transport system permease protein n=2 Tax=Neptunomonas TaxID=75687 RepID=A0A7R6PFS5_9GAMM|nr:urea transport system permease protein [Neptunomonas japonica JAMM 1380]